MLPSFTKGNIDSLSDLFHGGYMKYDSLAVAAIRSLCIDGINKAKSGHPGMALGSAPALYTLFTRHLVSDPSHPNWINRDRFVLSAGHASMLLYTMLHLAGYDVTMDDLKNFRQIGSRTPGHPEYLHTPGVDATSGPLGQGIAQAVGMAMAEQSLSHLHTEGEKIFNHYTYCLCGDGCLEEGVSQETISYAGLQKFEKLILFYDNNDVTLDGPLSDSSTENVKLRFQAAGWNVIEVMNGNSVEDIDKAICLAKEHGKIDHKPTMILLHTVIGYGSLNQGTHKVHGAPLGIEDGEHAKKKYGYNYGPFEVPEEVYYVFRETFGKRGREAYIRHTEAWNKYKNEHRDEANLIESTVDNDVSTLVYKEIPSYPEEFSDSTRKTSGAILNILNKQVPNLMGGSADVAGSVMTAIKGETDFSATNRKGRNVNWGIREFAMAAIQNGILLHGGIRTYVGCFLVFSDYLKPAIRMAALSNLPAIYLFSHDSIAVGEDGPTHQPVEQLAMLRSIPNVNVIRPCDARETAAAWKLALESTKTPTCLILSRQNLPMIYSSNYEGVKRGGYVVSPEKDHIDFTIIASGSEVSLAVEAQKKLLGDGIDTRVVSMPSMNAFAQNDEAYMEKVLGTSYEKRIAVEMLTSFGWHRYAKHVMSVEKFGASGNAKDVLPAYGFTADNLALVVKKCIGE